MEHARPEKGASCRATKGCSVIRAGAAPVTGTRRSPSFVPIRVQPEPPVPPFVPLQLIID